MSLILKISTNIVVPLCTEWLALQHYALLECSSQIFQHFLICLSEQYSTRFGSLFDSDMVVPITWSSVQWFERHQWKTWSPFEFTTSTLSMIKQELSERGIAGGLLSSGMSKSSSLVKLLKGIKRMEVNVDMRDVIEAQMLFLQKFCENLEEIHFNIYGDKRHRFLNNLPCGTRLVSLNFVDEPTDMSAILRQTVNLRSLQIRYCQAISFAPTMVLYNRNLTSFRVQYSISCAFREVSRVCFAIAFHCSKFFVDLQLPKAPSLLLRSFLFLRGGTALTSLNCSFTHCHEVLSILTELFNVVPNLTSLTLYCECLTSPILTVLASRSTQLKVLNLAGWACYDEESVQMLLTRCLQVSELNLCYYPFNDKFFTSLFDKDGHPDCISRIRYLSLSCCNQLTDSTLLCLSQLRPVLTSLDLSGLNKISDSGLLPILQKCKLRKLIIVHTSLTEVTFHHIAVYCEELREVHLKEEENSVNANAMLEIVRCCISLKHLWYYIYYHYNNGSQRRVVAEREVKTINPRIDLRIRPA